MAQADCITTAIRRAHVSWAADELHKPVRAAHIEFVAALAANLPYPIYADAGLEDLNARADHLEKLFAALHVYISDRRDDMRKHSKWHARSPLPRQCIPRLLGGCGRRHPQCCRGHARARELEGVMTLPFETAAASPKRPSRRSFIGGSDARIIMGSDDEALVRLWQEKRGEIGCRHRSARCCA